MAFLRGRPWLALVAAGSVVVATISTELLKLVILQRPDLVVTTLSGGINTFPSGHTTVGMSVCFAAMLVVPARLRIATALASGAIGAAFGVAVVAAGWHRPSDAVGSYLVCLSAASAAAAIGYRYRHGPSVHGRLCAVWSGQGALRLDYSRSRSRSPRSSLSRLLRPAESPSSALDPAS